MSLDISPHPNTEADEEFIKVLEDGATVVHGILPLLLPVITIIVTVADAATLIHHHLQLTCPHQSGLCQYCLPTVLK